MGNFVLAAKRCDVARVLATISGVLPKWVKDNRTAVLEEAAAYVGLTQQQRTELLRTVVRTGARQLADRADRRRLLDFRDPLPKSSTEALERLRQQRRAHGGRAP